MPSRIVDALIEQLPRAVIPFGTIAEALGLSVDDVVRLARAGEHDRLVAIWDETGSVVLDPGLAEDMGLELWSTDWDTPAPSDWRWSRRGSALNPKPPKFVCIGGVGAGADLDGISVVNLHATFRDRDNPVDSDDPPRNVGRANEGDHVARRAAGDYREPRPDAIPPKPFVIVVGSDMAWDHYIEVAGKAECKQCRNGASLGTNGVCLACLKSSIDEKLPKVRVERAPRSTGEPLAGGIGSPNPAGAAKPSKGRRSKVADYAA